MAADISAVMASLSPTEGSNTPGGTTSVSSNLDDNLRMLGALLAALRNGSGWGGLKLTTVAGTNTITGAVAVQGSVTLAPTAYATGMRFHLIPANSNTGAATLNVDSLGAKNIFLNGAALVGYELRKNNPVSVEYDGTQFNIIGGAHGGDGIPLGTVMPFAGTTAPSGTVFCFGQAISRATFPDLFAILSTTYGVGDGSTTFNVPDLRGRVVAGQDDMGGSSADRLTGISGGIDGDVLGNTGGEQAHTLTNAESAAHTHVGSANFATVGVAGATFGGSGVADKAQGDTVSTGSSGGGGAHNNVQPTLILNYVIKI